MPQGSETDRQLARLASGGDVRAQRMLVARLAPRVQRTCRAILRASADHEDAAQLALLEILRSLDSYSGASRLEAWADRITARVTLRHAAKERRHRADPLIEPVAQAEPTLAEGLARPLQHYLDALTEPCREVLVLRHALGYGVEEIAELTGAPSGTVKDRLVRARKQIRKLIARDAAIGVRRKGASQS